MVKILSFAPSNHNPIIRIIGEQSYQSCWRDMQKFTACRSPSQPDEVWILSHPSVFTNGQQGNAKHWVTPDVMIPYIQTDRGGDITYHGPGQLVTYFLLDVQRKAWHVTHTVSTLENIVILFLSRFNLQPHRQLQQPGVYLAGQKIAFVALRVTGGCCYHGVSLNVQMDLAPFKQIYPCGYPELKVTQLSDQIDSLDWPTVIQYWCEAIEQGLKTSTAPPSIP